MKLKLLFTGKTAFSYLEEGINIYTKRLVHYIGFELVVIPDVKNARNMSTDQLRAKEGEALLAKLDKQDFLVLLDERGKTLDSRALSLFLEKRIQNNTKQLCVVVGGAFGFSAAVYERADMKLSLSAMTFSHQMVRLFAVEQLYRAFTIIKQEPYHND